MSTEAPAKDTPPTEKQLERVTIRFAGDSGDGMQLTGTQFTRNAAVFGNDISTLPGLPGRDPRPGRLPARRVRLPAELLEHRDPHAGRRAGRARRDEPGGAQGEPRRAARGRRADRQRGRVHAPRTSKKAGYAANPLNDGSLKQWNVFNVPISTLNSRALEGLGPDQQAGRPVQELVRPRADVLAVRARPWQRRSPGSTSKFSKRPEVAEGNKRALKAGYNFGETTEIFHERYIVPPAKLAPGHYRNITGNEATALGFVAASKLAGRDLVLRLLPDHARLGHPAPARRLQELRRQDVPGRGRDRGDRRGDRRELRRRDGHDRVVRPGHRAEEEASASRSWSSCRSSSSTSSAPARPRACRPRPSRPTCSRCMFGRNSDSPVADRGARDARRLLQLRDRGVAHRAQVHDAGRLPVRRLPRQRRRAVADPGRRRHAHDRGPEPHRAPGLPAVPARRDDAGAAVGRARHARPRAPHRRPREGRHPRQRQLRPGQPRPDAAACARPRSPASRTTSRRSRCTARRKATCSVLGWGSTYGAIRSAVERLQGRGASIAHAHLRYLNPMPGEHRGRAPRFKPVLIPEINLGQLLAAHPRAVPGRCHRLHRVRGKPFRIAELEAEAERVLATLGVNVP